MKRVFKRFIVIICVLSIAVTSLNCLALAGLPTPLFSDEISFKNLMELYHSVSNYYIDSDFEMHNIVARSFMDIAYPCWNLAYLPYEEIFENDEPVYDKTMLEKFLVLPLKSGMTKEKLCNAIQDWAEKDTYRVVDSGNFEYLKLDENDTFCTGSIIRYIGEDADKYPYDVKIAVLGDIVGGEDTIGDGKVDILDVVKLRYCIINNECEEMKANNYPMFFASDLSYDDIVDIVDVVTLRNMIIS